MERSVSSGVGLIPLQKTCDERHGVLQREGSLFGLIQLVRRRVLRDGEYALDVLLHAGAGGGAGVPQGTGFRFQPLLQDHVAAGVEQFPEDLLAGLGVCQQKLEKIALGDHGHLGKLAAAQSDDLRDGGGDLPGLGDDGAVGQMKLRLPLFGWWFRRRGGRGAHIPGCAERYSTTGRRRTPAPQRWAFPQRRIWIGTWTGPGRRRWARRRGRR